MGSLMTGNVVVLADLVDPTDDGILSSLTNYVIAGLMVLVALAGSWHAFKDWNGEKGPAAVKVLRDHAIGVLAIEAFLGGILLIANEGTGIIPGLG